MAETIYSLVVVVLVSVLALNIHEDERTAQEQQIFTEATGQVTSVGAEVFGHMTRDAVHFDKYIYDVETTAPQCGRVTTSSVFTPKAWFVPAASYEKSPYLEGFDGMTVTIYRDGSPYEVEIDVSYADPVTFAPSSSPTFAKEVTLTISSPLLFSQAPGHPVEIIMSRIVDYEVDAQGERSQTVRRGGPGLQRYDAWTCRNLAHNALRHRSSDR